MIKRMFVALVATLLMLVGAPVAHAATEDETSAEPASAPPEVTSWVSEHGMAVVRSDAAAAFPDADQETIDALTLGRPVASWLLPEDLSGGDLEPSGLWVTPIMSGDNSVGALVVDFSDGEAGGTEVHGDPRLGTEAADLTEGRTLIFAPSLGDSWFIYADNMISPANESGANRILGEIPVADFITQAVRGSAAQAQPTSEVTLVPDADSNHSVLQIIIVSLIVIAVIVLSLLWLRWDQVERQPQSDDDESPSAKLHTRRGATGAKVPFRESAGTIEVLERPGGRRSREPDTQSNIPVAVKWTEASEDARGKEDQP